MKFRKNQAIYLQIADLINANIITGEWPEGHRIISVRELAAQIEVNPNTVMRAYAMLQDEEILYNRRGIGFFVSEGAAKNILRKSKESFIKKELPILFEKMALLDIEISELEVLYNNFIHQNNKSS